MSFNLSYALPDGQAVDIPMTAGDVLFVLGAIGTGKNLA